MKRFFTHSTYIRPFQEFTQEFDTLKEAKDYMAERQQEKRVAAIYVFDTARDDYIVCEFVRDSAMANDGESRLRLMEGGL